MYLCILIQTACQAPPANPVDSLGNGSRTGQRRATTNRGLRRRLTAAGVPTWRSGGHHCSPLQSSDTPRIEQVVDSTVESRSFLYANSRRVVHGRGTSQCPLFSFASVGLVWLVGGRPLLLAGAHGPARRAGADPARRHVAQDAQERPAARPHAVASGGVKAATAISGFSAEHSSPLISTNSISVDQRRLVFSISSCVPNHAASLPENSLPARTWCRGPGVAFSARESLVRDDA